MNSSEQIKPQEQRRVDSLIAKQTLSGKIVEGF